MFAALSLGLFFGAARAGRAAVSFAPVTSYGAGVEPFSVVSGDFNGDGKLDLAVANLGIDNVSILLGNGDGTFGAATNFVAGTNPDGITSGDFNGDGRLDLAVTTFNSNSNNVSILLNSGGGSFGAATKYSVSGFPQGVASRDFNGDGKLDLAVAGNTSNKVFVLLGSGTGTFGAPTSYVTGHLAVAVAPGDFNGDGKIDLATANRSDDTVSLLLGLGNGTFSLPTNFAVGREPYALATGDFNSDGKLDLAAANSYASTVSVLQGNGGNSLSAPTNLPVGSLPYAVVSGDFDGDSKLDLATANKGENTASFLLGSGNGTFSLPTKFGVGVKPFAAASGDFNGDGRLDLAVANYESGTVSVLLNTSVSGTLAVTLPSGAASYLEGDAPIPLDAAATVADPNSPNFNGGTLAIDFAANGSPDDRLSIQNQGVGPGQIGVAGSSISLGGVVIGSFSGGSGTTPLVVSFNAQATPGAVQVLARALTFSNVSDTPSAAPRTVRAVLSNGRGGTSAAVTKVVGVTPTNDAPVLSGIEPAPLLFTENGAATPITGTLAPSDADSASLSGATVSISSGFAPAEDELLFANQNGISGSYSGASGVLSLSGLASVAQYQEALRSVTYRNSSENPGAAPRTIAFTVSDGLLPSNAQSRSLTIASVNDAPIVAAQSLQVLEDTPLAITLGATDIDSVALSFVISSQPAHGTLGGGGASLTYTPAPNFNGADSFSFQASDGAAISNVGTVTLQVLGVDDAPVAAGDGYAVSGLAPLSVAAPGVLGNDSDADGEAVRASLVAAPAHGSLALNADGSFLYTPTIGFNGIDSFTYRASDATSPGEVATVTLGVSGNPSRGLSLSLSPSTVREGGSTVGVLKLSRPSPTSFAVLLSSSVPSAATVPAQVLVPTGASSVAFKITAARNLLATGVLSSTISASARDYGAASALLLVADIEVAALTFTVAPAQINESFGPAAAVGTITRNTPTARPLTVPVVSNNPNTVRVPAPIVIPAGARSVSFLISAIDNRVVNAPRKVSLTAGAPGFKTVVAVLSVADNGRVTRDLKLSVEGLGRFTERVGGQLATGSVSIVGLPLLRPLVIVLASSEPRRIALPASVVLPAGKSSVGFSFRVLDDRVADGLHRVFLTARSTGFGTSFVQATIADNDGPGLSLSLARPSALESAGSLSVTVTRINTPVNALTPALVVSLLSSNRNLASLPATVTIPRGKASVAFSVRIVNNSLRDGTRRVTLTASKTGLTSGTATLDVLDDDAPLPLSAQPAPLAATALSTATASASGGLRLRFWSALAEESANDAASFNVVVNGVAVKAERVSYDAATLSVALALPPGTVQAGDTIVASWHELQDAQGNVMEGSTGPLSVR